MIILLLGTVLKIRGGKKVNSHQIIDSNPLKYYVLGPGAAERHGVKIGDLTVSEQIVPCKDCKYIIERSTFSCV